MATKSKKKISKDKILKIGGISLLIIIICLISFFASNTKSTPYSNYVDEEGEEILKQATKDAGSVSDEERTSPKEISVSDYINLYNEEDKDYLVLISKPSCEYCKLATPILENIIYEENVSINYLNPDNFSEDDNRLLISSDSYFAEGYGTPLLLIVGNHSIKDKIEGLVDKATYLEFMKEYKFVE